MKIHKLISNTSDLILEIPSEDGGVLDRKLIENRGEKRKTQIKWKQQECCFGRGITEHAPPRFRDCEALPLLPVMLAIFDDIDVDMGWFDGDAKLCLNPIAFTPFTCPLFVEPKLSFKTDGCDWAPGCVCWCLSAFVRRFVIVGSRFRRTCSTGITRRRFFGSFDRAYANKKKFQQMTFRAFNTKVS